MKEKGPDYETLNKVINQAIEEHEKEKALEESVSEKSVETSHQKQEKISGIQEEIDRVYAGTDPQLRAINTAEQIGTAYSLPKTKETSSSTFGKRIRKFAASTLLPLLGLLPAKEAIAGGGTKDGGKDGNKTEHVTSNARKSITEAHDFHDISEDLQKDWKEYTKFAFTTLGNEGIQKLKSKKESDKLMDEFRKTHPGTTLNQDSIPVIQKYFQDYRKWLVGQAAKGKAVFTDGTTDTSKVMQHLSPIDKIGGPETLRQTPGTTEEITTQTSIHMRAPNGKEINLVGTPSTKKIRSGPVRISEQDEK